MNKIKRKEELSRLTTGGTSAAVASKSQRTPLQTKTHQWIKKNHGQREPQSNLSPENLRQTKSATTATQAKQSNKHNQKQRYIGNKHGDKALWVISALVTNTSHLGV